jgi:hypothetical protein
MRRKSRRLDEGEDVCQWAASLWVSSVQKTTILEEAEGDPMGEEDALRWIAKQQRKLTGEEQKEKEKRQEQEQEQEQDQDQEQEQEQDQEQEMMT